MITRRMKISIITGILLGIACIVGASIRSGFERETYWLFALWYNRLLMGFIIGAPWYKASLGKVLTRGAVIGFLVSFAFYSSIGFNDTISFLAGILYGVIIEFAAYKFDTKKDKTAI
ncbi:MAG: hypothetical protein ACQEP4_02620 [Bacillota bacterium]